tara:strand:+ start:1158 stop:1358 length:201 start_codon:yes stop_codon:yes gene_type:complete
MDTWLQQAGCGFVHHEPDERNALVTLRTSIASPQVGLVHSDDCYTLLDRELLLQQIALQLALEDLI